MVHRPGAAVARRGRNAGGERSQHDPRRRRRRHAADPQGHRVRGRRRRPRGGGREDEDGRHHSEEFQVVLALLRRSLGEDPQRWTRIGAEHQRGHRGDHHRRAPAVRDDRGRHPAVRRDQRQRLGDEVEVRQPLRLPPLARGRHQPCHRRDDRREDGRDLRLRRRRQGLRGIAARPGCARGRHRDRPDLRVAGGDAGVHDPHPRGSGRGGRHLRHLHRQPRHHPRRAHGAA